MALITRFVSMYTVACAIIRVPHNKSIFRKNRCATAEWHSGIRNQWFSGACHALIWPNIYFIPVPVATIPYVT
jgi:hypothetical protein